MKLERITIITDSEAVDFRGDECSRNGDEEIRLNRAAYESSGKIFCGNGSPDASIVVTDKNDDGDEQTESGPVESVGYTSSYLKIEYDP